MANSIIFRLLLGASLLLNVASEGTCAVLPPSDGCAVPDEVGGCTCPPTFYKCDPQGGACVSNGIITVCPGKCALSIMGYAAFIGAPLLVLIGCCCCCCCCCQCCKQRVQSVMNVNKVDVVLEQPLMNMNNSSVNAAPVAPPPIYGPPGHHHHAQQYPPGYYAMQDPAYGAPPPGYGGGPPYGAPPPGYSGGPPGSQPYSAPQPSS